MALRETLMWWLLAALVAAHIYEHQRAAHRAVLALEADGYTEVRLVGNACRVARAIDRNGERVEAYACAWSQ